MFTKITVSLPLFPLAYCECVSLGEISPKYSLKITVKSCPVRRDMTNNETSLILLAMHQEKTRERVKKFQACQGHWHKVHTEMQPDVGCHFGSSFSPTVVPESLWRRHDRVWNWDLCWWSFADRHAWAVVNPPKTPTHHKATQQPRGKLKHEVAFKQNFSKLHFLLMVVPLES